MQPLNGRRAQILFSNPRFQGQEWICTSEASVDKKKKLHWRTYPEISTDKYFTKVCCANKRTRTRTRYVCCLQDISKGCQRLLTNFCRLVDLVLRMSRSVLAQFIGFPVLSSISFHFLPCTLVFSLRLPCDCLTVCTCSCSHLCVVVYPLCARQSQRLCTLCCVVNLCCFMSSPASPCNSCFTWVCILDLFFFPRSLWPLVLNNHHLHSTPSTWVLICIWVLLHSGGRDKGLDHIFKWVWVQMWILDLSNITKQ